MAEYSFEDPLPDSLDRTQKEIEYWTRRVGEGYAELIWERKVKARLDALYVRHHFLLSQQQNNPPRADVSTISAQPSAQLRQHQAGRLAEAPKKLDGTLQRQILDQLRDAYPNIVDFQSRPDLQANLFYLRDCGFIKATESEELGPPRILWASITASGLDFLTKEYEKEPKSASVVSSTTTSRDERRRQDLERGLQAARSLQRIHPDAFAKHLNESGNLPLVEMEAIEILRLLTRYIEDPDCRSHLQWLCSTFDSVRREKSHVRINEKEVEQRVRTLQNRIQWFIDSAREELSKGAAYTEASSSVFSLHGIRTRGVWQKNLTPVLTEAGFIHTPLDYGHFAFWKFLIPSARQRRIEDFLKEYTEQTKHTNPPGTQPSIIAHSFGTYIVTEALRRYPELRFTNIILCGSIVSRDYPWSKVTDGGRVTRVLNERAKRDLWVRLVPWVVQDADASGVDGFNNLAGGRVIERHHPDWHHSEFFYRRHYIESWVPFLRGEEPGASGIESPGKWNWRFQVMRAVVVLLLILGILYRWFLPSIRLRSEALFAKSSGDAEQFANELAKQLPQKVENYKALQGASTELATRVRLQWEPVLRFLLQQFDDRVAALEKQNHQVIVKKSEVPLIIVGKATGSPRVLRKLEIGKYYSLTLLLISGEIDLGHLTRMPLIWLIGTKENEGDRQFISLEFNPEFLQWKLDENGVSQNESLSKSLDTAIYPSIVRETFNRAFEFAVVTASDSSDDTQGQGR